MKKLMATMLLTVLLSGCSSFRVITSSSSSLKEAYEYVIKDGNSNTLKGKDFLKYSTLVQNTAYLPSTGSQRVLVIPILFKNHMFDDYTKDLNFRKIDTAFNGDEIDTGYESVSSYYYKSSYGKLDLSFDVYKSWIELDKTVEEVAALTNYRDPSYYVVDFVSYYLTTLNFDLTKYDNNKDGYVDGVWFIYGETTYDKYSSDEKEIKGLLWAYTYWKYNNSPNLSNPSINAYCFASYDFMNAFPSKIAIDAHTYIHETGHLMGLEDYYDYSGKTNPILGLDMMDYNIGDHNSFSKMLLGWSDPIVYDEDTSEYTLEPYVDNGDFLIIPSNVYSSSPFEEYLLLEFYTPTNLNKFDSLYSYMNHYPKMYSNSGVRVFHVDARLAKLVYQNGFEAKKVVSNYSYDDLVKETNQSSYFSYFNSNTPSYSYNPNSLHKLIEIVKDTSSINSSALYSNGVIEYFKFNNGEVFNKKISIKVNNNRATISFG